MKDKKIYTRSEVRELLNVSLGTLRNWDRKGILKPRRIGRRNYYYDSDIQNVLENSH